MLLAYPIVSAPPVIGTTRAVERLCDGGVFHLEVLPADAERGTRDASIAKKFAAVIAPMRVFEDVAH